MATASQPIILKITEAGLNAALTLKTETATLAIDLTHIAIGMGSYTPTGNETQLLTETARDSIVSGSIDSSKHTLRFSSTMTANTITPVYELGVFMDDGTLFALASSADSPLFTIHPDISFVGAFGLTLDDIQAGQVTVNLDQDGTVLTTIMQNHTVTPNPHPQYVSLARFQLMLDILIPVGYLHYTHDAVNPKPQFDELMGFATKWRRLNGKIIVATDPDDNYIKDVGLTLGQKGMTTLASDIERPHVYPLYTTNVFERYDASTDIETVWQVSANKASINEGSAVRFIVSANNIPDGQALAWTINEGDLNSDSNDITSPEKTDNGTITLINASASIDYLTTDEDNAEETQKHVRLTLGAPANLSINVPINDAGLTESAIHITQSTLNGIVLDEYYKQQQGDYPQENEHIRFIVNEGVDVIAPDANTPAITEGSNWLAGSQIVVENRGRILGRGGNGGKGAVLIRAARYTSKEFYADDATNGQDGGTAIKSGATPILIENYNLIAGGGGGGGGGGAYAYDFNSSDKRMGHQNGTAAGGGAPLGRASINAGSFEWYVADSRNPDVAFINKNIDTDDTVSFYGISYSGSSAASATLSKDGLYFSQREVLQNSPPLRSAFKDAPLYIPAMKDAIVGGKLYNLFRTQIDADVDNRIFFQKKWPDAEDEVQNMSIICKRGTDATVDQSGLGGYSVGAYTDKSNVYQSDDGGDLSINSGGGGGGLGESGETFILSKYLVLDNTNNTNNIAPLAINKSELAASRSHELAPAQSGLAGKVFEGSVTVSNFSSGTSIGRS